MPLSSSKEHQQAGYYWYRLVFDVCSCFPLLHPRPVNTGSVIRIAGILYSICLFR